MMRRRHYLTREDGFTLVELLVVMAIFVVVIYITTKAFDAAIVQTKTVSKSEESNIEGLIGLEMLRHDLEQAGFGLFTAVETSGPPVYAEATGTAATYNDSGKTNVIPRAVVAGENISDGSVLAGTDYLAIKATTVARNKSSQKWTYISGVGNAKVWGANDFTTSDYVVVVQQKFVSGELQRKLIYDSSDTDSFSVTYKSSAGAYPDPFGPPSDTLQYYYYGIDDVNPRAPFNRTDYFVQRTSSTPTNCAPGAGVLYKTVMSQTNGSMSDSVPIMDCVADMQVVFEWDTSLSGAADAITNADFTASVMPASPAWSPTRFVESSADKIDPADIRKHLRLIKVYILAQDGAKDLNYKNSATAMPVGKEGEANTIGNTRNLTTAAYQNYRWKLHRIVVKPKNIIQMPLVQ